MSRLLKVKFRSNCMIVFILPLILLGKVVRYTIMKSVLVMQGIGWRWIAPIISSSKQFLLMNQQYDYLDKNSSTVAILFYRATNIFCLDSYLAFEVAITIVFNLLTLFIILYIKRTLSVKQIIILSTAIVVLNIFSFTLSKEPIQMLFFFLIFFILIKREHTIYKKAILIVLVLFLSSIILRTYYALIAFFMACCVIYETYLTKKPKNSWRVFLEIILFLSLTYYIILVVMQITNPTEFAEIIRLRATKRIDATTEISPFFSHSRSSTNLPLFVFENILVILRLLFPIELLSLGPKYLLYFIFQLMITFPFLNSLRMMSDNTPERKLAAYVYLGFLFASALFEPDFGSWIRHESVSFPVLLYLWGVFDPPVIKLKPNGHEIVSI